MAGGWIQHEEGLEGRQKRQEVSGLLFRMRLFFPLDTTPNVMGEEEGQAGSPVSIISTAPWSFCRAQPGSRSVLSLTQEHFKTF